MNPSERIDEQIAELADWRGQMIARLGTLIREADPTSLRNGSGIPQYGLTRDWFVPSALSRRQ
jgi:hypothetical protein